MNKFNLTFSGEILSGYNPAEVKRDFGKLFAIDDPARLESFFSGQTVILRRNLERKDAAQYFHQLNLLGAVAAATVYEKVIAPAGSEDCGGRPRDPGPGSRIPLGTAHSAQRKRISSSLDRPAAPLGGSTIAFMPMSRPASPPGIVNEVLY